MYFWHLQSKIISLAHSICFKTLKRFFKHVGCDWIVDSNTTEDSCGICGGKSKNCTTLSGEFLENVNPSDGYYEIITIPLGSRNILIEEMGQSKNYISIGKSNSKEFYLNGNGVIALAGEYNIAGAMGLYERDLEMEMIRIPRPIKYGITLYVCVSSILSCIEIMSFFYVLTDCYKK